jgi:type VI secretion system secreted protein VgrG
MLHSSLPADAVVHSASVEEGLSALFRGDVVFVTDDDAVELEPLLWSTITLEVYDDEQPDVEPRPFHGMITSAAYLYQRGTHHSYRLVFEPSLCTLRYRSRSRIFQEMTAQEIITQVISDAGLDPSTFVWNLSEPHSVRTYCVQYRESELAFVLRLLEHEGIYSWFEHDAAGHTMHLADAPGPFDPIDGDPNLAYTPWSHVVADCVHDVVLRTQVTHDAQQVRDWDWMVPGNPVDGIAAPSGTAFERYEYPAAVHDRGDVDATAARRLGEAMQQRYRLTAQSNSLRLRPGRTIGLIDVKPDALVGEYLLVALEHRFQDSDAGTQGPRFGYSCVLEAQRADFPFRPPRVTPLPRVEGIDSAVVTGPGGEEIHVDETGQIKAHFYWDREGAMDDTSSCWIRVQQNNTSGAMILPRIGWEMSMAYIDGDPDRPLAIQKLYNLETMPPYGLPANQTQSAFQSSTSPGGGSVNEVRMQDASGGQELAVYASRDYHVVAGHDKTEKIGVDASEAVSVDSTVRVGVDQSISIGGDQTVSVTGSSERATVGSTTFDVGANDTWGVTATHAYNCGGSRTHTIGSMHVVLCNHFAETVNGSCTRTIGAAHVIATPGNIAETVGGSKSETVGAAKMELVKGTKSEQIGVAKALTSGAVMLSSGKDIGFSADGAIAVTSAGSISEKVGAGFAVTGSQIHVTAPGGATLKGGSGKFVLKGATLKIDTSKFGSGGGPKLELKGKVDWEK